MGFNLKEKLLAVKDRATTALALGVVAVDQAAENAIELASDIHQAVKATTSEVRQQVGEKIDAGKEAVVSTKDAVKAKTVEKLGQLGQSIDKGASNVSSVAAQFGKNAKAKLDFAEPAVVAAKKVVAAKPAAKKPAAKAKKPAAAKKQAPRR